MAPGNGETQKRNAHLHCPALLPRQTTQPELDTTLDGKMAHHDRADEFDPRRILPKCSAIQHSTQTITHQAQSGSVRHSLLRPSQATPQPITLPLPPRARHSPIPTTKWLTSHVELHPTTSLPHAYGQGCTPRHSQATQFTGSPTLASAEPGRQTHACQVRRYQATDDTERTPMQHLSRRLHCM